MDSTAKRSQQAFVIESLDKYERPLTRYVSRILGGDLAAARDVVQHAFLKLCEQDSEALRDRVAPWLYRVCRNRAIDIWRGRNNFESLDRSESALPQRDRMGHQAIHDPAHIVEKEDFQKKVWALIDELSEVQKEIVELWCNGLSSQEIGEVVDKKPGAVRIAFHRAIQKLKSHESVRRWMESATVS